MKKLIALFLITAFSANVSVACDIASNQDLGRTPDTTPIQADPDKPVSVPDTTDAE